jgi:hypothetical protein
MRIWMIAAAGALGACSSPSTSSSASTVGNCCIIDPGGDAGPGPSCWCPAPPTEPMGGSISTTIAGTSCTVTIVSASTTPDGSVPITAPGTVPTSAEECAIDLPIGG